MTFLLDVNVLIALVDPTHVAHDIAHSWFDETGAQGWATCPMTENGVIRIIGNPRYPNSPGLPAVVAEFMSEFCAHPAHAFWPDDISLLSLPGVNLGRLAGPQQVTDTYLLALAVAHRGRLATLDRKLSAAAVARGKAALYLIG